MNRTIPYKNIQLPQLRSFCLVATQGSFSAAAKVLQVSVAAVWEQVRALERKLGAELLHRHGRHVELTEEGRLLLDLVQPYLSGLDSLERLFELRRGDLPQQVCVVSTPYLLAYHLLQPVRSFTTAHPAVRLNLRAIGLWQEVPQQVERGQADLGVVGYDHEERRSPYVEFEDLFDTQLTLLTSVNHPLLRKRQLSVRDLVQYPLILSGPETQGYQALERLLQRHELTAQMHVVLESNQLDVIRQYVTSGVGIALLYMNSHGTRSMPGLRARVFDPNAKGLTAALVTRKGAHLAPVVEEFRRTIRQFLSAGRNPLDV